MNTKSTFKHWITLAKKDPNNIEILKRMTTRLLLRNGIWINDRTKMLIYHKINKELPLDIATYNAIYAQAIRTATNIANSFWLKYNANLIASNADVIYIFEKYIHSIKPPNLNNLYTLMMESPLGTGKTEWFYRNYIQKHRESASIIIIVPRRSLAKITANRFQIIDYEDAKGNNIIKDISIKGEAVQMSICVNSLPTLVSYDAVIDVVFLDEFDLTIQHLLGDAVANELREDLFFHLIEIIRNAKHVICTQSLLSNISLTLLKIADRHNPIKIVNTYKPTKDIEITVVKHKTLAINKILHLIEDYIPVLCPCTSAETAGSLFAFLQKHFPNKKLLLLTAENSEELPQIQFMQDPNYYSSLYDVIVYTSLIGIGISITNNYFYNLVGICSTGINVSGPESFLQMLLRGRNINNMTLFIEPQYEFLPETPAECILSILTKFQALPEQFSVEFDDSFVSFKLDSIIKLALQTTVMQNVVRNNSSRFIYKILTEYMECNVHLIDKEPSKKLKHVSDAVKSGRELRRKQYINNVMSARTIDLQEYKELEARHKLQQEDYWAVRRYRFESELCINVADITNSKQIHELFRFWDEGRGIHKLLAFEEAVGSNLEANNSHLSLRKMIRSGILNSLRISFDEGVFRCDSDMVFSYDELMQEEWYNFIKNNVTLINTIGLGCCISSKVDKRDIGYIIRTMGIKFSLKRPSRSAICDGKRKYFKDRAYQIDIKSIKEFIATLERRYNNRIHYENKYN